MSTDDTRVATLHQFQRDARVDYAPDHLTKMRSDDDSITTNHRITKPSEWFCTECGSRITVDPDDGTEYGHARRMQDGQQCSHCVYRGDQR